MADDQDTPVRRRDAILAGHKYYDTGAPCKFGHPSLRLAVNGSCVECAKVLTRGWRAVSGAKWRARNKDKIKVWNAKWAAKDPDGKRLKCKRNTAAYRARNPERADRLAAEWRAKNRERVRANCAKWRARNAEKTRELSALNKSNRRSRIIGNGGRITAEDVRIVFAMQRGKCAICGVKICWGDHQRDHIVPLTKGGRNDRANLQITCTENACNQKKRNKDPIAFMRERGFLL